MKFAEKMRQLFKEHEKLVVAVFLIILGIIIYIPRIWQLGFYAEDWYVMWGGKLSGFLKIFEMHLVDRPMLGLHSAIMYYVFGDAPLPYHLYILFLRILSSIILYFLIRKCFIDSVLAGLFGSITFLVYPGFLVQPVAFTHSNYMLAFLLSIASLLASSHIIDNEKKRRKILFIILAGGFAVISYSLMEWFITFELVRIILFYRQLKIRNPEQRFGSRLMPLLKKYLPVGFFIIIFVVVRFFIFKSARSTTDIGETLKQIFQSPIEFTINIIVRTFENIFSEIFAAWVVPLYRLFNLTTNTDLLSAILIAFLSILFIYFCLKTFIKDESGLDVFKTNKWGLFWLSLFFILVSLLPLGVINRTLAFDSLYSKYTLPGLFGVSLLITILLTSIQSRQIKNLVLFLLVFLGVITNQLNSAYYRDFTDVQNRLWWQLSWRAPSITEGTTLLPLLPTGYRFSDNWEIWTQANLTYGSSENPLFVNAEVINSETIKNVLSKYSYGRNFRKIHLDVDMNTALVAGMASPTSCVHVIDGDNYETMVEDENLITLISERSKINMLDVDSEEQVTPNPVWFGSEPDHDWCYYYQKASLYRQQEKWKELNQLADEVIEAGITPKQADEWLPMYEGYIQTQQMEGANYLSNILKSDELFVINYCPAKLALLENGTERQKYITGDLCSWFIEMYR